MDELTVNSRGVAARWFRDGFLLLAVALPLLATVYAVVLLWNRLVTFEDLSLLVALYVLTGLGVTMGFHRMLTHRSFSSVPWLRAVLLVLGSMAMEGPAIEWAATHLKHHAKADMAGDPHSPLEGFFHAHLGWLFRDRIIIGGAWARPFADDPVARFVSKTFVVWAALGLVIPFAVDGWRGLLWGGAVRIFLLHHVTWSVNSVCHTFGKKAYATPDESRNEWVVGLIGLGEGWHNNHHAAPRSAFHGFHWWQFDLSGLMIRALARLGLVHDVVRPPLRLLRAEGAAAGDPALSLPDLVPGERAELA